METCWKSPFGILVDEEVIFIASLVITCLLSVLLMFILAVVFWLIKIRTRVDSISKHWSADFCRLEVLEQPLIFSNKDTADADKSNSWKHTANSFAYGPCVLDEDEDLKETSFGRSTAAAEDEKSIHGLNIESETVANDTEEDSYIQIICDGSTIQNSSGDHPEKDATDTERLKTYMSLKGPKDDTYENLREGMAHVDSGQGELNFNRGQDEKVFQGEQSLKTTNGATDSEELSNEYDHGYLVVVRSDKSSETSEEAEKGRPSHEDDSQYLLPVDSEPKNKRNQEEEKGKESDPQGQGERESLLDHPEEDKYGYLSTQNFGIRMETFGHSVVPEHQQTRNNEDKISKGDDEDRFGYLIVQHGGDSDAKKESTSLTENPVFQNEGVQSSTGGQVAADDKNDDNYDYVTAQKVKDWTGSPDVNASMQFQNINKQRDATGITEPGNKTSAEDSNGYLAVIHHREDDEKYPDRNDHRGHSTTGQENQDTTEQIYATIQDNNNDCNKMPTDANSEAIYVNQDTIQKVADENTDDLHIYANSDVQQDTSQFSTSLDDVDESPIYDNDIMKA